MREILQKLAQGKITVDEAEKALRLYAIEKVGQFARLDVTRELRRGVPEIVLGEGKSDEDIVGICKRMLDTSGRVIVTRLNDTQITRLKKTFTPNYELTELPHAKSLVMRKTDYKRVETGGRVGIVTAGTVDLPIAEEAAMIAQEMGCKTFLEADAGVAGIHRLVEPLNRMIENDVDSLIVVAGREGALPTVVAGLVDLPLIAVPTSSGYGYGGRGEGALMAMLQACSLGIAVVNIDSGIAAGVVAGQIANRVAKARTARPTTH